MNDVGEMSDERSWMSVRETAGVPWYRGWCCRTSSLSRTILRQREVRLQTTSPNHRDLLSDSEAEKAECSEQSAEDDLGDRLKAQAQEVWEWALGCPQNRSVYP
jgi:hypothetical protein